jgi:hypothetical protein
MSHSINWELLRSQYFADDVYREEITKLVRVDKVILPLVSIISGTGSAIFTAVVVRCNGT